jgi:uncharacterized repeat protein (TIGR01451 family)
LSYADRNHGLLKGFVILFVLLGFIGYSNALENSQLQWDNGISGKLQRGQVINYNGYSVEAIAFPPPVESEKYKSLPDEPVNPYVGLKISKNGTIIDNTVLGLAESYISPDGDLKVTAKELPFQNSKDWLFESYNPWAIIQLDPRGMPHLEVSVATDDNEYISISNTEIVATVTLKNTGSADAVNVDMNIDTKLPVMKGNLNYHYERVRKGEVILETVTFSSPILIEKKFQNITASIRGYDVKEITYKANFIKNISLISEPNQILHLRKSTITKTYLKDNLLISLSLRNSLKYDLKNVSITDSIPDSFEPIGNNSLHWVVDIPANTEWDFFYTLKPRQPDKDGIFLPAAKAEFTLEGEFYNLRSEKPRIVVYGPKIVLRKQTDVSEIKAGDTLKVTVIAENKGNTPTKVTIKDNLPKDATVVSGNTSYEEFLEANKNVSFSYILKFSSNESIKLPSASADYYELGSEGGKISTMSQELEIYLKSPNETLANSGKPMNWIFGTTNGNSPIWDSVYHSGLRSIKISIPGTTDGISGYPQSDLIAAGPFKNYTFSAWVKTLNAGGSSSPAVRVVELGVNKNWIRQTTLSFNHGTNGWEQKQIVFQTGLNTSYLYVYANIWNGYGTFWVDDVVLRLKSTSVTPNLIANPGFENDNKSSNLTISSVIGGSTTSIVNGSNKSLPNEFITNKTASKTWNIVNTILNLILGCNENSKINSTFNVCNLF